MPLDALATMITLFTRGCEPSEEDLRWIDQQMILPASPLAAIEGRSGPQAVRLPSDQLRRVGQLIAERVSGQLELTIWAMTLQPWYAHLVIAGSFRRSAELVACVAQATHEVLGGPRNVWVPQGMVRYCFDSESVRRWIAYVESHNRALGWPAQPWPRIAPPALLPEDP